MTGVTHTEPVPRVAAAPIAMRRLATGLPLLLAGGLYAAFIARSSFSFQGRTYYVLFDDAMISMRYAHNLADGHGLVWNAGQDVEGYSNFLWTLWMSLLHLVGLPDRSVSVLVMVTSAGLLLATLLVVRRLCALLAPGRPLVGALAMLMTALFYPLSFWALRGMEVGLAAFLTALAALLVLELRAEWSAARCWALAGVLGAAVLTRDDLFVPCAIVLAFVAWQFPPYSRRRTLLIVGGTVVAVIAGHELLRLAVYGDALPNTYYLKLGGIPLSDRLVRGAESFLYAGLYSLCAPLLLAAAALALRSRANRAPLVLLGALFVAQSAYSVYVGGDAWEDLKFANRYVATAAPLLMVLAAVGAAEILPAVRRSSRIAVRAVGAFAVVGALLVILYSADRVPHGRLGFAAGRSTQLAPALLVLACAAIIAVVAAAARRSSAARWAGATTALLAIAAIAAASAVPAARWVRSSAQDLQAEKLWTETGVAIREHTTPGTPVALAAAGNIAYFDGRPAIDLLGKMDPVVAHGKPTTITPIRYRPGHNKWNYAHSIGALRPPVVASLWWPTARDLCDMARWGYQQVGPRVYLLEGAARVDAAGLAASARQLNRGAGYPAPPPSCRPGA
ncbi:MAG TPA: hypothetical protein VGC98_14490 [Thermoleophilaceae bacterium]